MFKWLTGLVRAVERSNSGAQLTVSTHESSTLGDGNPKKKRRLQVFRNFRPA